MDRNFQVGYCTNVHAGITVEEIKSNLERHALIVKEEFSPSQEMGIGLWLPNDATQALRDTDATRSFKYWLDERGLYPFTFNAFPFNDFHQPVVKHKVYEPTWATAERLEYTIAIANIHSQLIGEGEFGTISTLPLSWPNDRSNDFLEQCARQLIQCAESLAEIHDGTGRHIFLCIEPEPGCTFGRGKELADFFERFLIPSESPSVNVRDYIGACHDVCHCAVMFDDQANDIQQFEDLGIRIGKFQISSAIEVNFKGKTETESQELLDALSQFAEDRYLHQTCILPGKDLPILFYEDLPIAIKKHGDDPNGVWRIHFHVPVFADQIGLLGTTTSEIEKAIQSIHIDERPLHFEVETYAWTVLPDSHQPESLARGIANELVYFKDTVLPELNAGA